MAYRFAPMVVSRFCHARGGDVALFVLARWSHGLGSRLVGLGGDDAVSCGRQHVERLFRLPARGGRGRYPRGECPDQWSVPARRGDETLALAFRIGAAGNPGTSAVHDVAFPGFGRGGIADGVADLEAFVSCGTDRRGLLVALSHFEVQSFW